MKKLYLLLIFTCSLQPLIAEEPEGDDLFGDGKNEADDLFADGNDPLDYKLSDKAKKTLSILKKEKFEAVSFRTSQFDTAMAMLKKRLEKSGIKVRLKLRDRKQNLESKKGVEVKLVNIPLRDFMFQIRQYLSVGYIIYEDGSITYMDQCGCCWPSAGVGFHKSQFDAGHPQNFDEKTGKWKILNRANNSSHPTPTKRAAEK